MCVDYNNIHLYCRCIQQWLRRFIISWRRPLYLHERVQWERISWKHVTYCQCWDHGSRYGEFIKTIQGKLNERLPLFTTIFPKSCERCTMFVRVIITFWCIKKNWKTWYTARVFGLKYQQYVHAKMRISHHTVGRVYSRLQLTVNISTYNVLYWKQLNL